MKSNNLKSAFQISLILVILVNALQSYAQVVEFTENKGQWDRSVLFKGDINNGAFFLQRNGFTVLLHNPDDITRISEERHGHASTPPTGTAISSRTAYPRPAYGSSDSGMVLRSHAYRMHFLGSNEHPEITQEKPMDTYENYFIGNDPSRWASGCQVYQAVTYKNIYPNIDIRYYASGDKLKYDIIIYPVATPAKL